MKPYKKIFEFTIADWKNQASNIIKRTRKERNKIQGREAKVAKLIDVIHNPPHITLMFSTPKTFDGNEYEMLVQLIDADNWKDGRWNEVTEDEFKQLIHAVDLKFNCECPHYHWGGIKYNLSQLDSAIETTSISDPIWGERHNKITLCKHLYGIVNGLSRKSNIVLKAIKKSVRG